MNVPLTLICLAVHALALYGWGRGFERSIGLKPRSPAVTVALGLACVIGLGGLCNLVAVAHTPTLWALTAMGLVLALWPGLRTPRTAALSSGLSGVANSLTALCAFSVCVLVVSTLIPPWSFNYHDDYQKYFAHPVRMLQTGSLQGSGASALGFETLGGQAFLHGFVLSCAGFDALNAVDLGFALPLCVALAGVGPRADALLIAARLLAVLCVLTLNPQVVNISATYTASALCLAWIELGLGRDSPLRAQPLSAYACASGVLFAALCALKTTFVLVSALLLALTCAAIAVRNGGRTGLRWASIASGSTALALSPWLFLHAPMYLTALQGPHARVLTTLAVPYHVDPLSLARDLYGGDNFAAYTFAVATSALLAGYAWRRSPIRVRSEQGSARQRPWAAHLAVACAAALVLVYVLLLYVVAPRSQGAVTIMRLFAPILIAFVPGLLVLAAELSRANPLCERLAPLLLALGICTPFVRGVTARWNQALRFGSILAFPDLAEDTNYIRYNQDVLYGAIPGRVAASQAAVPDGAPLIALTNTPFWLDFARNPIADIEPAGLATPWTRIPTASYVIWEFDGFATIQPHAYEKERDRPGLLQARIGDAGLRLTRVLIGLARSSPVVYSDGHTLVMKLASPASLRDGYNTTVPTR